MTSRFKSLSALAAIATLSGCATQHSLTAPNGNTLQLAQYFCRIGTVEYSNNSAGPTHQEAFRFVATDAAGQPKRQWTAYCAATPANSKTSCLIHEDVGTGIGKTSLVCSEYKKFALVAH